MFAEELFSQKIRTNRATPLREHGGYECHGLAHAANGPFTEATRLLRVGHLPLK